MLYNWQQDDWHEHSRRRQAKGSAGANRPKGDWPEFRYLHSEFNDLLNTYYEKIGHVGGLIRGLDEKVRGQALVDLMVSEAIKTSEIEGELLNRTDVMSSIRSNLGLQIKPVKIEDERAKGIADLTTNVHLNFERPLTKTNLLAWHKMLLIANIRKLKVGSYRTHSEPMQVISQVRGKLKVHFEAPDSKVVPKEMNRFLKWFNQEPSSYNTGLKNPIIRSAIAHLYFESIHPFEDGNGRLGRALSLKALSQSLGRPVLLSLSETIEANKKGYYRALQRAQRSNEITAWLYYFCQTILEAQTRFEDQIMFTLKKTKYFDHFKDDFSDRHLKVIRRMFEAGPSGFKGGMTAKKYIALTKTSKATATRDLSFLLKLGALIQAGGGRNVHYNLNLEPPLII